jgi:hypothetical protein
MRGPGLFFAQYSSRYAAHLSHFRTPFAHYGRHYNPHNPHDATRTATSINSSKRWQLYRWLFD